MNEADKQSIENGMARMDEMRETILAVRGEKWFNAVMSAADIMNGLTLLSRTLAGYGVDKELLTHLITPASGGVVALAISAVGMTTEADAHALMEDIKAIANAALVKLS
jgi:hypothetical protein